MTQLFSATEIQHLPQSVLSVKSKNGLNAASTAGSSPVLDFDLHGSIGYYLASDLCLSFDFEYTSTDGVAYNLRPQNNMGLGGMIRQISIYSLQDGVLLEEIQDVVEHPTRFVFKRWQLFSRQLKHLRDLVLRPLPPRVQEALALLLNRFTPRVLRLQTPVDRVFQFSQFVVVELVDNFTRSFVHSKEVNL